MPSFLIPQRGHGGWQQSTRSHQPQRVTFLRPEATENLEQGRSAPAQPAQRKSFLLPTNFAHAPSTPAHPIATSHQQHIDVPRTVIVPEASVIEHAVIQPTDSPEPTTPEYTLKADVAAEDLAESEPASKSAAEEMAAATRAIPPHLRKKKAFATQADPPQTQDPAPKEDVQQAADVASITEKLSTLGVKVTPPQADSPQAKPPQAKPPQPAADRDRSPSPGPVFRGRGNRGRGRGGGFPRPPPIDAKRWDTEWDSAPSIDSAQADSGHGGWGKKRAPAEESWTLTDFTGNWAPAPINWDARPAFHDSTKVTQIEQWIDAYEAGVKALDRGIPTALFGDGSCDLVPRYWILETTTFFAEQLGSKTPVPLNEGDLDGAKPWWECLADGPQLKEHRHPDIAGIDPEQEEPNERLAREADFGSAHATENRKRLEKAKREALKKKKEKQQQRAKDLASKTGMSTYCGNRIKPRVNGLFIRSARATDMVQVRDIYNHYVRFTCSTPETEDRTTADMTQRFHRVLSDRFPFLVACERGAKIPARRRKNGQHVYGDGEDMYLPDKIIGFASADDYQDMNGMYRFTCEVEVYIHNEYTMKNVATCLLDKLMALLDPVYIERGGFELQGDDLIGMGPSRTLKNIITNVPYDRPERLEWISRWMKSLHFEQTGNMTDIGNKNNSSVSLATFLRRTGAEIDPANPPLMMRYPS